MSSLAMLFDLMGDPPTAAQIAAERERLNISLREARRARRRAAIRWGGGAFLMLASLVAQTYWHNWALAFLSGVGLCVVLLLALYYLDEPIPEEAVLADLDPVRDADLDSILKACQLDPRVDAYRCKVAQQSRDFVVAEAQACWRWYSHGYRASCNWAAVRATVPLEREDDDEEDTLETSLGTEESMEATSVTTQATEPDAGGGKAAAGARASAIGLGA